MAIRNIRTDDAPILRKVSKEVKELDDRVIELLDDLIQTMQEAQGVGLAAVQVGVLKRVVVIDVGEGLIELINPKILSTKGEQIEEEGCLSLPGLCGKVKRPAVVKVEALNRKGEKFELEGRELLARAICHELDHLEGVLFKDKVVEFIDIKQREAR